MLVEGISYQINWRQFKRGYSLFFPCLNCVQARKDIYTVLKRLKFKVVTKIVIEDGIRGLRIWRM